MKKFILILITLTQVACLEQNPTSGSSKISSETDPKEVRVYPRVVAQDQVVVRNRILSINSIPVVNEDTLYTRMAVPESQFNNGYRNLGFAGIEAGVIGTIFFEREFIGSQLYFEGMRSYDTGCSDQSYQGINYLSCTLSVFQIPKLDGEACLATAEYDCDHVTYQGLVFRLGTYLGNPAWYVMNKNQDILTK